MARKYKIYSNFDSTDTLPGDWNPSNNTVECYGAGGKALAGQPAGGGFEAAAAGGGGGGGYAKRTNVAWQAGQVVTLRALLSGNQSTCRATAVSITIEAEDGKNSVQVAGGNEQTGARNDQTGGLGGQGLTGDLVRAGGRGGAGRGVESTLGVAPPAGGGGGGAAGPDGAGADGGNGGTNSGGQGGTPGAGGGGGANGGGAGANGTNNAAGAGGTNLQGSGAGTAPGGNGVDGGGGGGGRSSTPGGNGSMDVVGVSTEGTQVNFGPGSGPGGGTNPTVVSGGGDGYGWGAGGEEVERLGGPALIVLSWEPRTAFSFSGMIG